MGFFTNYSRNAYPMDGKEIEILKAVMSKVEDGLPFPVKPSEAVDGMRLMWAPEMILSDDSTFGMWTYMHVDSVFIRPEENVSTAWRIEWNAKRLSDGDKMKIEAMKRKPVHAEAMFPYVGEGVDHRSLDMLLSLLEADGHMASTILHEMWHRQQFLSNPVKYFASCLLTNIVVYDWACTQKWSIEHDVRMKVDNDGLHSRLRGLYVPFYNYVYKLNHMNKPGTTEEERKANEKETAAIEKTTPFVVEFLNLAR